MQSIQGQLFVVLCLKTIVYDLALLTFSHLVGALSHRRQNAGPQGADPDIHGCYEGAASVQRRGKHC